MKRSHLALFLLAISLSAAWVGAENRNYAGHSRPEESFDGPRHRPGRFHHPPPPPVMVVIDSNKDGKLDAQEIAKAAQSLLELDENGDGELTFEELRPPFPPGFPPPPGDHECPEESDDQP